MLQEADRTIVRDEQSAAHAALYFRVSTGKQDLDSQRKLVYALAEQHFPGIPTVEYLDDGVSASKHGIVKRQGSSSLLDDIEADKIAAVICDSQDRLSRGDEMEMQFFLSTCQLHDTRFLTPSGELTLTDEDSLFVSRLVTLAASFTARKEVREKAHRSTRGRRSAAERGIWPGGSPPVGYDRSASGVLQPNADAPLVQKMFEQYDQGAGVMEIAREIASDGWTWHRVGDCLDNLAYVGTIKNGGILYPRSHPPLIDQDLFQRVQEKRSEAKMLNRRQTRVQPFTSSILRCGECGDPLRMHSDKRGPWLDYECHGCRLRYRGEFIDLAYLGALAFSHEYLSNRLDDPTSGLRADQDVELVTAELSELQRRMLALLPLVEDGDEGAVERHRLLQADARAAEKTLRQLQASVFDRRSELETLKNALDSLATDEAGPIRNRLVDGWLAASVEQKNQLIISTTSRVEAHPRGILVVKLRALAQTLEPSLELATRHSPRSKHLREVGFGAGSAWCGSADTNSRRPSLRAATAGAKEALRDALNSLLRASDPSPDRGGSP